MMIANTSRQKGLTFWSFIWSAALLILFSVLLIKSIPPYLDNYKLQNALQQLAAESKIIAMSRKQMIRNLEKQLNIDYAISVVNIKQAFKFKGIKGGKRELWIDYEVVVPLAYNASLLFDFKNHVIAPLR